MISQNFAKSFSRVSFNLVKIGKERATIIVIIMALRVDVALVVVVENR